jgi:hypothetical protein
MPGSVGSVRDRVGVASASDRTALASTRRCAGQHRRRAGIILVGIGAAPAQHRTASVSCGFSCAPTAGQGRCNDDSVRNQAETARRRRRPARYAGTSRHRRAGAPPSRRWSMRARDFHRQRTDARAVRHISCSLPVPSAQAAERAEKGRKRGERGAGLAGGAGGRGASSPREACAAPVAARPWPPDNGWPGPARAVTAERLGRRRRRSAAAFRRNAGPRGGGRRTRVVNPSVANWAAGELVAGALHGLPARRRGQGLASPLLPPHPTHRPSRAAADSRAAILAGLNWSWLCVCVCVCARARV